MLATYSPGKTAVEDSFELEVISDEVLSKIRRAVGTSVLSVFHVSKEASPLVSFGGVGQIVGDLARTQVNNAKNFVGVILPKYGFIDDSSTGLIARFSYIIGRRQVSGNIFHVLKGEVNFLLVGPPSSSPTLWSSKLVEDSYNCPRGIKPQERDLYFTFVASKIVGWLHLAGARNPVLHAHGATNVPILWFLKNSLKSTPELRTVYTMHDYDSEPGISYTISKVMLYMRSPYNTCEFRPRLKSKLDIGFGCGTFLAPQVPLHCMRTSFVVAAYFASCADYITTVSSGMVGELLHTNEVMATLILAFSREGRILPIQNWVSDMVWEKAREMIPLSSPADGKLKAKLLVSELYSEFGMTVQGRHKEAGICFVGWMGRFEKNKGVDFLPSIMRSSCQAGCAVILMGYSTNRKHAAEVDKIFHTLVKLAEEMDCPMLVLRSKSEQLSHGAVLRASLDVVVVPSMREAFGLVAAEGLAFASLPVVSSVGGLPEVISPVGKSNNWTGVEFPYFSRSEELTSVAICSAVSQAITLYHQAKKCGDLDAMLRRLINSTPLKRKPSNMKLTYEDLYAAEKHRNQALMSCSG